MSLEVYSLASLARRVDELSEEIERLQELIKVRGALLKKKATTTAMQKLIDKLARDNRHLHTEQEELWVEAFAEGSSWAQWAAQEPPPENIITEARRRWRP